MEESYAKQRGHGLMENPAMECIKQIKSAIPISITFERHGDGRLHIDGVSLFDAMRHIHQIIDNFQLTQRLKTVEIAL